MAISPEEFNTNIDNAIVKQSVFAFRAAGELYRGEAPTVDIFEDHWDVDVRSSVNILKSDYNRLYIEYKNVTDKLYVRNQEKKQDFKWLLFKFAAYFIIIVLVAFIFKWNELSPLKNYSQKPSIEVIK